MLAEFMGAIRCKGEQYLNFLVSSEKKDRISAIERIVKECNPPAGLKVQVFGSFLRQKLYNDIDLMVVYDEPSDHGQLKSFEERLQKRISARFGQADITLTSSREFPSIQFRQSNLEQVYPLRLQR
jgi:predicted nucleotidyltransferase